MMVKRIITTLIIIFDSVEISTPEYELSKQPSKDHWVETRPPGGGMQQHDGCRWNCFAWSSPVGGRESGGRVYFKSSRVVATMGGVGRRRTGRNSFGSMSISLAGDFGVLLCSDKNNWPSEDGLLLSGRAGGAVTIRLRSQERPNCCKHLGYIVISEQNYWK